MERGKSDGLHTVNISARQRHFLVTSGVLTDELVSLVRDAAAAGNDRYALCVDRESAERVRDALIVRVAQTGFGRDYELTADGAMLEELIDRFAV